MSNQFFETIFLKDDSTQDYQLQLMKSNPFANKEELYMLEAGVTGEKQVMYYLKKSNIGMYALRDINLQHLDYKAQIDFVLVTNHHCYFVECKNYNASRIKVDEASNFSAKYGRTYQGIPSPISQANNQLNVLEKMCLDNQEKTKELLKGNRFKDYFKTITVFTNEECLLDLKKAPKDIKYRILKVDNLLRQIDYDNKHFKGVKLNQDEMKAIANFFLINNKNEKFEKISTPKTIVINNNNTHSVVKRKRNNSLSMFVGPIVAGIVIIILSFLGLLIWLNSLSSKINRNSNSNSNNNLKSPSVINNTQNNKLTENQIKALSILKSGFEGSKNNGFEIIHTSVCREISSMLDDKLSCYGLPLYVNYSEDDKNISIYHQWTCYRLTISNDNELLESSNKYIGYDIKEECTGLPIGILEWDENNEYYQKIGGYNKIREMAIEIYKDNKHVHDYCDYNNIEARGGNKQLSTTYLIDVDNYFHGITGKGLWAYSDTTKEEFEEMVKNYYYIMK